MKTRDLVKSVLPPLLILWAKQIRDHLPGHRVEWEYIPEGWARAQSDPRIEGWNVESILDAYRAKWDSFLQAMDGTGPLGTSPEAVTSTSPDLIFHNAIMIFAYALALAARHKTSISMLDWGGGLGHYYLFSKALVPDLEIDYYCKDMPVLAEYGQQLLPQAHFYSDDSCLSRRYDFILASTSLHYSQDWAKALSSLAASTAGYLLVTGLPIVHKAAPFVFVQRPYDYGYRTEYLGWCLNRQQFINTAEASGMQLMREFIIGYQPFIYRAPEKCEYRGFLFRTAA